MSRKEEKKKEHPGKKRKTKEATCLAQKEKEKRKGTSKKEKKKKRKRRRRKRQCAQQKKKKGRKELDMGIFVYYATLFSFFNFFLILGRKLFGRSKEKTLGFYNLFFFLLTQPNTLQKILILIFTLKFYIYPILRLNKHTLIHTNYLTFLPQPNGQG